MVVVFSLLWRNKFSVTLFSYTVWTTAMKFGMITGIGAEHVFSDFGELWPRGGAPPQTYMHIVPGKKEKLGQRPIQISPGKKIRGEARRGSRNWGGVA